MDIKIVKNDEEILECFDLIQQLVNSIKKNNFLEQVKRKYEYGYKIVRLKKQEKIISIIGIRIYEYFGCGKFLIIDDFVTDKKMRNQGYGKIIFEWVVKYAEEHQCSQIQLDSNIELFKAHKFYMSMGMNISHHHFSLILNDKRLPGN
jgi:GNAT superfamily N-acetyltransferase